MISKICPNGWFWGQLKFKMKVCLHSRLTAMHRTVYSVRWC